MSNVSKTPSSNNSNISQPSLPKSFKMDFGEIVLKIKTTKSFRTFNPLCDHAPVWFGTFETVLEAVGGKIELHAKDVITHFLDKECNAWYVFSFIFVCFD
jgi:hypothetical protein